MSRPDPSARASRKLTSHRLLGQRRTVEVRGAPLMRKSRVTLQGHVGLRRHLAHKANEAASSEVLGLLVHQVICASHTFARVA